jgi:signal transduction histidine kinase/CheY-like chemotaxis protein
VNDEHIKQARNKIHPALGRSIWPRAIAYVLGCPLVISALPPDSTWVTWLVLFIALAYPTLYFQLGRRAKNTRFIGFAGYYLDAFFWSLAVVATHYSVVLLAVAPLLAVITGVLMLGSRRGLLSLAVMLLVFSVGHNFVEVEPTANFFMLQGVYGWSLILVFMLYITLLVNGTTRRFVSARHQLEEKNLRIMEQTDQLESISKVAQLVNSTLDTDEVMTTVMERLNRVFDFSIMAILFLEKEKQTLCLDRIRGDIPDDGAEYLQGFHIPLSEQHSAFTMPVRTKQPRYLPDVSADAGSTEGVSAEIYKLVPSKSLLTFPLIKEGEVQGVLAFANTNKHFYLDDADIEHIDHYVTFIVSALRNASDYREIQEARAAADAANKAKSQFLANMSHELRTPMNAVIGYSEMLEEEAEDQGLDDLIPDLQKIRSAGNHLLQLINDVLDLSKIEADKVELYHESFDIKHLLMDVEATAKPLIDKNGNRFEHEQLNELGDAFQDQTKMRQVVLNLLSNAAKFTNDGLIRMTADRTRHGDTAWLAINVTDTGIGMTTGQLEKVFDPFSQADSSTTREYGGTGLGLSISRKFCEMMGGTLIAQSEKGTGSTFTMRVPIGTQQSVPDQAGQVLTHGIPGEKEATCVLVIDDDAHVRDLMQRLLSREGYNVIVASNGEQGIELAREARPDVITLDVLMPGQDGWSVLNQLKADPDLANIPVVMQSILDESNKAFMLGASDYLTKPINRSEIIDVVRRLQNQNNRCALVVEDDINAQTLMAEWLKGDGWEVHTAKNGLEGLQAFLEVEPGLIILDLMMPAMDGFEFLEQVRLQPKATDASVIVVTAKDLNAKDLERLNGGVKRIIQKGNHKTDDILKEIKRSLG